MQVITRTSATLKTLALLLAIMGAARNMRRDSRHENFTVDIISSRLNSIMRGHGDSWKQISQHCATWMPATSRIISFFYETRRFINSDRPTQQDANTTYTPARENVVKRVEKDMSSTGMSKKADHLREKNEVEEEQKRERKFQRLLAMTPAQRKAKWIKRDWARYKKRMARAKRFAKARKFSVRRTQRLLDRIRRRISMNADLYAAREARFQRMVERRKHGVLNAQPVGFHGSPPVVDADEASAPVAGTHVAGCVVNGSTVVC